MNNTDNPGTVERFPARAGTAIHHFREKYGWPGSVLKMIAIITMLIDHTGAALVLPLLSMRGIYSNPELFQNLKTLYYIMRRVGRLAFPIFCFLLVEGFVHTHNVKKYAQRMFLFALISEFPFDWALKTGQPVMNYQNVYFTLLIGLLVMWGVSEMTGRIPIQLLILVSGLILAHMLKTDYAQRGVFLIEVLYILRTSRLSQCLCGGAFIEYEKMPAPLAFIPVFMYNGKRGRQLKYFFYCFYPVHLMILGIIRNLVLPSLTSLN